MEWLPSPEPPKWAVNAGLPEPYPSDTFCEYVNGLGLDCDALTKDLTPRTAALANVRLASRIAQDMPAYFWAHARARFLACHTEQQVQTWERRRPSFLTI